MSARHLLLSALLLGMSGQALADTWSDLWSTHEQQGQQLLDANHPDKAAQLFSDPKRRAYAELQAGQYAKAADLLAPLEDADSQYNRGNALARTGKLRDALAAYNAALASSPGNKDVMRNRELVAKALESQQQPQQGKDGKGQSNKGGSGSNGAGDKQSGGKDSGSQDGKSAQAGQQGQSAQQGQNGNQGQADAQNQSNGASQAGSQQQAANQAAAGNQTPAGDQPRNANPAHPPNSAGNASSAANSGQSQTPQQAASAATTQPDQHDQRNAAALQQGQASGTGTQQGAANMAESPLVKGGTPTDAQRAQPRSEQALALDQWLRSIPEDSGELLRRKFQIEHMLRQQGNEP